MTKLCAILSQIQTNKENLDGKISRQVFKLRIRDFPHRFWLYVHAARHAEDVQLAAERTRRRILVAAIIELVGGFMIMVGLFASIAAFLASGTMAVAYFMAHQSRAALPIQNQGELAVAFCFAFLYIASRGSGVWSVDGLFRSSSTTNGS
jgi:uncharacterized membrane protein YphA (DoxX/SURF4 family)